MDPQIQAYWVPKLGNSPEEYEDAYAFSQQHRHLAIADGATESSYADRWAKDLVNTYINSPLNGSAAATTFPPWLAPLQERWRAGIDWQNLPWFAEEKAKAGAFATFLGVSVINPDDYRKTSFFERATAFFRRTPTNEPWQWNAVAVGDSCLFQIRDGKLIESFPLEKAEEFNSRPVLLCSNPANNLSIWPEVRYDHGECKADDLFILATDAVAKWFLDQRQAGGKPWDTLEAIKSNQEFQDFVARLRSEKAMRNDDTTIVLCRWKPSAKSGRTMFFKKT